MVSFFGLKLGSDKKKAQAKQPEQDTQPKSAFDRDSQHFGHNFSRPQAPSSRPGTSHSSRRVSIWRAPWTKPEASSSMVDLPMPRRPSVSSLRHNASDADLKARLTNGASAARSATMPVGQSMNERRPTTSSGPGTSRNKEWVGSPVNSASGDSRPGTPLTTSISASKMGEGSAQMSPLSQFEFGLPSSKGTSKSQETAVNNNGYPSPPASIESSDRPFAQANAENRPSSSRRNFTAPSGLRRVDTAEDPSELPSPAPSTNGVTEDRTQIRSEVATPVIRNVKAKRDTFTFHQPRRRSVSGTNPEVPALTREKRAGHEVSPPLPAEGFQGNFAAFDFGENVRKGSVDQGAQQGAAPGGKAPMGAIADAQRASKESRQSGRSKLSGGSIESAVDPLFPRLVDSGIGMKSSNGHNSVDTVESAVLGSRWPTPPNEKRDVPTSSKGDEPKLERKGDASLRKGPEFTSVPVATLSASASLSAHAPATALSPPPARPPPIAPPVIQARKSNGPPPAASGARRANIPVPDIPVSAPTPNASSAQDSPPSFDKPRGFNDRPRSSSGSGPTTRAPPKPLQLRPLADRSTPSPRSPFGPAVSANSYERDGSSRAAPKPPSAVEDSDVRPKSSYARPMEGAFPVSKGLPRGRRPTFTTGMDSPVLPLDSSGFSFNFPNWAADRANPRQSAMVAPLSPLKQTQPSPGHSPKRPYRDAGSFGAGSVSTPTSATAPRLPSPTFPSLESDLDFAASLDFSFGISTPTGTSGGKPLISPVMGDFGGGMSGSPTSATSPGLRVEAKKAPPRPGPTTVPPSKDGVSPGLESVKAGTGLSKQLEAGFI